MFDHGSISLSNGRDILIARQANDPDGIRSFIK
jgi:putative restriction endonuclease